MNATLIRARQLDYQIALLDLSFAGTDAERRDALANAIAAANNLTVLDPTHEAIWTERSRGHQTSFLALGEPEDDPLVNDEDLAEYLLRTYGYY